MFGGWWVGVFVCLDLVFSLGGACEFVWCVLFLFDFCVGGLGGGLLGGFGLVLDLVLICG